MKRYCCPMCCNVIYEEVFANLPDDWHCFCGMGKECYEVQEILTAKIGEQIWTYRLIEGGAELIPNQSVCSVEPEPIGDLVIPEKVGNYLVRSVGEYAFMGCKELTSVQFGWNVAAVGYSAFKDCVQLKSIVFSNPWFSRRLQLGKPTRGVIIHGCAFKDCCQLQSLKLTSVGEIGYHAFQGCVNLKQLEIPDGVTDVSDGAFAGCKEMVGVAFVANNARVDICDDVFSECGKLAWVDFGPNVSSIGSGAFEDCESLSSIKFKGFPPEGLEDAGIRRGVYIEYEYGDWFEKIRQLGWVRLGFGMAHT